MKPSLIAFISALTVVMVVSFRANTLCAQDYGSAYSPVPAEPEGAVDSTDAADSQNDQVLEIPQAAATDNQSDAETQDSADNAETADSPGDVTDYANQTALGDPNPGASNPAPITISPLLGAYPINPRGSYSPYIPPNIIVARPGGLNSIPATSPMLTTPRGSRPIMGGWWQRARR